MSEAKYKREKKKQLGQFMTPRKLVKDLLKNRQYNIDDKILEPSFGEGSFIIEIIYKFIDLYDDYSVQDKIDKILSKNIYGVEMDSDLYQRAILNISNEFNVTVHNHNLVNDDFFNVEYDFLFDYVEGNPPFGGTFETSFGEKLDKIYGFRDNEKIKKETYSFFTVKSYDLLKDNGVLGFVCSDTFLTINTMKGLRKLLSKNQVNINRIDFFSDETNYGMVYFELFKNGKSEVKIDSKDLPLAVINQTENYSFNIPSELIKYFTGVTLKKYITCSSGMTIGKNKLFLKEKIGDYIVENYEYFIKEEVKTEEKEIFRNKFNKLTEGKRKEIEDGVIEKVLEVKLRPKPLNIKIPNIDYMPYNKAVPEKIYSNPKYYVYWKDEGEAVYTFKKTGKWYLHGVGGKSFFKKEGLTWNLISDDIKVRYLPKGYILDSGCPVGVLNDDVDNDELYFIIGWMLSTTANKILKTVINHTKNIQSKDIERLPYPIWVKNKEEVILYIKNLVNNKMNGKELPENYQKIIDEFFS